MVDKDRPLFILAGNGPYDNRGCEAIVRGTAKILRTHFDDPRFICISHFNSVEQFERQCASENDDIIHLSTNRLNKRMVLQNWYRPSIWKYLYQNFFDRDGLAELIYGDMLPHLPDAHAVLSVGGDNYSLDYGVPSAFTMLDDLVLRSDRPQVIWGASVGPFDRIPDYEKYMSDHLRKVTGIFARESATVEYLNGIGVADNVHSVADPAFAMEPIRPEGIEEHVPIGEEIIGLNLSPLMSKYVTGGDLDAWTDNAASIIHGLARSIELPICLIPHVTNPGSNDHEFMQRVLSRSDVNEERVTLIPPTYDAAETKWVISQMAVFAGARTHSTIASLSSCVPTLSFAYSIKARGINEDFFGHLGHLLEPSELNGEEIAKRIISMLEEKNTLKGGLRSANFTMQERAMSAGEILRSII